MKRIGLLRHFEVDRPYHSSRWMDPDNFSAWLKGYDEAEILPGQTVCSTDDWDVCYTSDISRALKTARLVYNGTIIPTSLIREISVEPFTRHKIWLPFEMWNIIGRFAWYRSHPSQIEDMPKAMDRARCFIKMVMQERFERVLVVSHGGMLWLMRQELLSLGFQGQDFKVAENGKLYVFERKDD